MTSLQQQLSRLKTAPTRALAVERDHSSLLFDPKEAAAHDRNDFYKIGLLGLAGLKKLDDDFDAYAPTLFEKNKLHFNRAMLGKEAAQELNAQIEAFLLRLLPHFQHQCCRQVLEWLIYNYQIHLYNAESLFLVFLPFHSSNAFGRLLHTLTFNSPDWEWLSEYKKDAAPVPLNILCRACQAGRSYGLISTLTSFVQRALDTLDDEYVTHRVHFYFSFLAQLFGTLLENQAGNVDAQLISRLMPFLGVTLKSKLPPVKSSAAVVLCALSLNVHLEEEVAQNALHSLLYKLRPATFELALHTMLVLCQRLELNTLPRNAVLRIVYNNEELGALDKIQKAMQTYDASALLYLYWPILIDEYKNGKHTDWRDDYVQMLVGTMALEWLGVEQAGKALELMLDWAEEEDEGEGAASEETDSKQQMPKALCRHVRAMAIRFPTAFDAIRATRKAQGVARLMQLCHIAEHEVVPLDEKTVSGALTNGSNGEVSAAATNRREPAQQKRKNTSAAWPGQEADKRKEQRLNGEQAKKRIKP